MDNRQILNDTALTAQMQTDPEYKNLYYQEKLILEVTETIAKLMQKQNVSKTHLAERLGKGRSHVTQLLAGTSNMTLRTISDVFVALNSMLIPAAGPLSLERGQAYDELYYEFEDGNQSDQCGVEPEALEELPLCPFIRDMAA